MRGADPETFRFLMPRFGTDAMHVYRETKPVLPEANAAELRPVLRWFARDGQHVFWMNEQPRPMEGFDPSSFEELDFWYVKDKAGVYYMQDRQLQKLAAADPATFKTEEFVDRSGIRIADAHDRFRRYREGQPVAP